MALMEIINFLLYPTPSPSPAKFNPELKQQPLIERIVHALAVKPYSILDLYRKFCDEGLSDDDRRILPGTLRRVGLLRDGRFELVTWEGVNARWKFYTDQEAQAVQLQERKPRQSSTPNKADCLPLVESSLESLDPIELVSPVQHFKAPKRRRNYRLMHVEHLKRRLDFSDCEDMTQTRQPKIRRLW